jgi:bifunctional UDP-N-acetylglucosamine pyrophosphorylase/glucosamine-1-phosphate N-acetyltransferase
MQAIVLAAGEGTRIRPLSETVPKAMLPVAGRPLMSYPAEAAVEAGAEELVIVVGYGAEVVRDHFGDSYRGVPVTYAVQETQAGTADAVRAAAPHVDGPFVVLNGDNLYDPAGVAELFDRCPSVATYRVDEPSNYGVVVAESEDDYVDGILEKPSDPPGNLINAGAYALPPAALDYLDVPVSERGEYEFTAVLDRCCARYAVDPVLLDRWLDVGRPWELLAANEWKLGERDRDVRGDVSEDARIEGDVVVEAGATVRAGAVVEGPALLESGVTVGPNAYVRGTTALGPDVTVGHAVEVKNSVLMSGTSVSHLAYVGDSILGRDVNLGAGTQVANLRHDGQPIENVVKGRLVSTGRRKFGVVAGDGAKTGVNTSLNPGITLSTGATTRAGETVTRDR